MYYGIFQSVLSVFGYILGWVGWDQWRDGREGRRSNAKVCLPRSVNFLSFKLVIIASGFPFAWNCDRLLPSVCCLSIHIEEELHGVLLSTKAWKVAEDTVSVRNKILSTNLSRWGDAKSKAKVKKKFPENFGALYPGKNGPLGERILKVQHAFPHSKNQWLWSNNKCTAWFKR